MSAQQKVDAQVRIAPSEECWRCGGDLSVYSDYACTCPVNCTGCGRFTTSRSGQCPDCDERNVLTHE